MATEEGAGEDKMVKGEEAPPFHLTERDKWLLSITDEEFTPHTWEDLKEIIGKNISFITLSVYISVGIKRYLNHIQ